MFRIICSRIEEISLAQGKISIAKRNIKRCEKEKTGWDGMLENFGRVYIKGIDRGVKFGKAQGTFFQWIERKAGGYGWRY